jgi:hypothetical protein
MSGKTTLARKLATQAHNNGRGVFILDPMLDPAWKENGADFVTKDPLQFLALAKKNKNCTLFIDEAGEYCGQYAKETWWLATQARHWGHQSIFISQRANMVARNIRDNCKHIYAFRVSYDDAKLLANDFTFDQFLECAELPQGTCIYASRYGEPIKFDVFA